MDFIKDRGNIKWTAMMLPEHRMALIDLQLAQEEIDPPYLDPDQLAEIAQIMARAMQENLMVRLRYWENKRHAEAIGILNKFDLITKMVLVCTVEDEKKWIKAKYIVDIDILA